MNGARRLIALAAISATARAGAQQPVRIDAPARASSARTLRAVLAAPHDLIVTDSLRRLLLPWSTALPGTLVILGGDASVGASVNGDVVVVGGDLFLHPGASIEGRAIAIGGAVYGSTLARVAGGTDSFRDQTYDVRETGDGITLVYRYIGGREPPVELPVLEGLRVPSYDRVDGAIVPWGPLLRPTARLEVEPLVTYRSHLGAWDPGVRSLLQLGDPWRLTIDARRGTFTNDAWIHSDLINSINTLFSGVDTRNYYRADRGEVALGRLDRFVSLELESYAGVLTERAWSAGSPDTLGSRPWSLHGRGDADNLARGNPSVTRGRISSAFVGAAARWQFGDVRVVSTARLEVPWQTPGDARFAQLTADGTIQFPMFGTQRFRTDVHVVATPGDTAPPQRFAYLGGSGTLPVVHDPLSLGGDQLFLVDSRYEVPIQRVTLRFVGSPVVAVRHRIGSAGVQRLPRFTQNVGAMVTLGFFRVEHAIDPATRKQRTTLALSFAR